MDPTAQTPSSDQTPPSSASSVPNPTPNPDEQAATARGDSPIQVQDSISAVNLAENEAMNSQSQVQAAQIINNNTTEKEVAVSSTPQAVSDHGKSADQIHILAEKVKNAVMPEALKSEVLERIARLEMIRSSSGFLSSTYIMEYETTVRYVNWVVTMPWDKKSAEHLDLNKAKEIMDKNHYGLEPLKQRVLEYIASIMLNIKNHGQDNNTIKAPILCIVGLAGTGKTTFASSIADALGRNFERIPFGGMADSRVLRGQSRYFPDAEPGQVIKRLVNGGTKNPVLLLDELDRVTDTARADIMGVLIEVLDPEQNAHFTDHYIDYPFNLQNTIFIATANNVSSVSTAVLDRLEIIQMPSYNDEEKTVIGRDYVLPKTMKATGLLPEQLAIDNDVWAPLIRPLGYDPGIRGLDRLITGMCRKAATQIVLGKTQAVRITNDNVKQFLPEW